MQARPIAVVFAAVALAFPASAQDTQTVRPETAAALAVGLDTLKAELRPLRKAQVEAELAGWLRLLEDKCLELREVQLAALAGPEAGASEALEERRVALRAERAKLIERVNAVVASLESKGGEVEEAKAYVSSVIVVPPVSGWRSARDQALAWVKSPEGGLALARRLGLGLVILAGAWVVARLLAMLVRRALSRVSRTTELMRDFLVKAVSRCVLLLGLLAALSELGVSVSPILAGIGAAGLVLGLALQGTLGNLASGLMILIYRPFDTGDAVETGGAAGKVDSMSLMSTRIKTFDNQIVYVPNGMVWNDVITNKTASATRRVDMVFGVSYGDDLRKTQRVLEEVVMADERVLKDPEPMIRVHALGESSINFIVRPWVKTDDYWPLYWDLNRTIKERFDAEGITIPFPQRDVHLSREAAE